MKKDSENYVIVRADKAGVFFGQLVHKGTHEVTLNNCRKLYRWRGATTVEQIALEGIVERFKKDCQFTVAVDNAVITKYDQIIPCSKEAIESINSIEVWKIV